MEFASIPYSGRLSLGRGTAEKQSAQGFSVERDQGPEIAEAPKGRGGGNGQKGEGQADEEPGQPEQSCGQQQQDSVEADGVAEFHVRDGQGGQQRDGGVEQHVHGGPVQADSDVADDQAAHDGQGAGELSGIQGGRILEQVQKELHGQHIEKQALPGEAAVGEQADFPGKVRKTGGGQQERGQQKQAYGDAQEAHQPEIRAYRGALVIILRALGELEDCAGEHQNQRRVVHQHQDMAFQQIAAGHVGALRRPDAGQRVPPALVQQQLFQAFGAHGQGGGLQGVQGAGKLFQQFPVDGVRQIRDGHVGLAFGAHGMHGEHQFRGTDTAAYQVGIEQQCLHEAVPGALRDPFQIRLRDAPTRIGAHIDQDGLGEALDEQRGGAAEHVPEDFVPGIGQRGLGVSDFACQVPDDIVHGAV